MKPRNVFISYSREDLETAKRLEQALLGLGVSPWRDQESIYAGQQWPKAIGEAISTNDLLLLLWSRHSAQSHFVEFEWTTAIALQKTIIPCLLDKTPLVPSLISFNGISLQDFGQAVARILKTIEQQRTQEDKKRSSEVLKALQGIAPADAESMAQAGSIVLTQFQTAGYRPVDNIRAAVLAPQAPLEGLHIGERYDVIKKLGHGGMGAVYQVFDKELERDVALKVIRSELAEDPSILKRFKREIQLSSTVTHSNVLRVYDLGESEGIKFLTMQYVEGEDLASVLKREGRLPIPRLLRIFRQICQGLAAAHEKGILHRDLKPPNVMIDRDDQIYLTDFGLARSVGQSEMTQAGVILGTPYYMSPEQVKGEPLDIRSDIYSLGVILYEMATGEVPYCGESVYEVMIHRVQKPPRPALELNPEIPAYLEQIVERCMAIEKVARYETVQELLADLDRGMDSGHTQFTTRFYLRRWRGLASLITWRKAAVALTMALLLVLAGWWLWQKGRATSPPPVAVHKPVSVLIADFRNQTGDPVFDGTLEQTLETGLEGASFVTTFNRGQARKIAGQLKEGAGTLDVALARLVAAREGINIIVDGSITRQSGGYEVAVKALDALNGQPLATETVQVKKKEEVLGAAGKLSARIRKTLGDTTPESVQLSAAETFTATSLEAAQSYAFGQELQGTGQWEKAIPRYLHAVELDPNLGRAYAGVAVMHRNLGHRTDAEKYYQTAMERIDRMTDRERYRTRGGYFVTVGNHQKAIEEFKVLVQQYPADFVGHSNLALSYFLSRNMPQALQEGRRATEIYPKNVVMRSNLSLYAMYAGDFETATREASAILKFDRSYGSVYGCLALSHLAEGRPPQALEAYQQLQNLGASGASAAASGLADLALYEGRLTDAVKILEKGISGDLANKDAFAAARKSATLAATLLHLGQTDRAISEADRAAGKSRHGSVLLEVARVYIRAKQEVKALELASELGKHLETEPEIYAKLIEGEVQLQRGSFWEAIKLFHEAQKPADTWLARFDLGRAYLEASAFTEAYSEFEQCLKRRGESVAVFLDDIPTLWYLPPLYYYLGRAQQGLKSPAAAESYRTFVKIKEKGDQDPLVADARRRLATY